jgi:hypothetical protein
LDLAEIAADDALLDALGRGAAPPADDRIAGVLAAWRAELDTDPPASPPLEEILDDQGADSAPIGPRSRKVRRVRKVRRFVAGVAAAALVACGLAIAADHAGPTSPLWPLTRVMYPQEADQRLAGHQIAQAREAIGDRRYEDARRLLDDASASVNRIRDQRLAQRLRDEIEALRRLLPGAAPAGSEPGGSGATPDAPTPAPSAPGATPGGGPGPGGGGTPTQPGGGIVPGLPVNPPSLPVPVPPPPSLPVPPLPSLPVPVPSLPL